MLNQRQCIMYSNRYEYDDLTLISFHINNLFCIQYLLLWSIYNNIFVLMDNIIMVLSLAIRVWYLQWNNTQLLLLKLLKKTLNCICHNLRA